MKITFTKLQQVAKAGDPRDDNGMADSGAPCNTCAWRSTTVPGTCDAFPGGIPAVYLLGYDDHSEPSSVYGDPDLDDHGLTYKAL